MLETRLGPIHRPECTGALQRGRTEGRDEDEEGGEKVRRNRSWSVSKCNYYEERIKAERFRQWIMPERHFQTIGNSNLTYCLSS